MTRGVNRSSVETRFPYDAFVSYSSVDRRAARHVQQFLESWIDKRDKRRLRIFLDTTDIRGGRLDTELRRAAHGSRTLVVCYSPAAVESRWVEKEVQLFRERAEPDRIAIAVVGGNSTIEDAGRELVEGAELRVHDLRRGRWLGLIGLGVKLELLRLLAFVADVDLRTLRNWHLRRTIRLGVALICFVLVPPSVLLQLPLDDWQPHPLTADKEPLYAIGAEASGDKLIVASRYRRESQERPRNYIRVNEIVLDKDGDRGDFSGRYPLRRHLLPRSLSAFEQRMPTIVPGMYTNRKPVGEAFVTEIDPGRWLVVQALSPSADELEEIRIETENADLPIAVPETTGSLVIAISDGKARAAEIDSLLPHWPGGETAMDPVAAGPVSPFKGLPVAWTEDGQVWLGAPGWDARVEGGLWHSGDGGRSWARIPGFLSVSSIVARERAGRLDSVVVAEAHFDRWRGSSLEPYSTRVVEQRAGEAEWTPASMPPYGSRSEVELCGMLGGAACVRVDETVYTNRELALWRFLLTRLGISP